MAATEFPGDATEVVPVCYPIEIVTKFELKETEGSGWVEQADVDWLIRRGCVISLGGPLGTGSESGRVLVSLVGWSELAGEILDICSICHNVVIEHVKSVEKAEKNGRSDRI